MSNTGLVRDKTSHSWDEQQVDSTVTRITIIVPNENSRFNFKFNMVRLTSNYQWFGLPWIVTRIFFLDRMHFDSSASGLLYPIYLLSTFFILNCYITHTYTPPTMRIWSYSLIWTRSIYHIFCILLHFIFRKYVFTRDLVPTTAYEQQNMVIKLRVSIYFCVYCQ